MTVAGGSSVISFLSIGDPAKLISKGNCTRLTRTVFSCLSGAKIVVAQTLLASIRMSRCHRLRTVPPLGTAVCSL